MSYLDVLLGAPNFVEILPGAVSSGSGGTIAVSPPALIRSKSGNFSLAANGILSGLNATVQFAGPSGAVGPKVGCFSPSAHVSILWIDNPGASVGQSVTYRLNVVSTSGGISIASTAFSVVIIEL